jgi:hypothetical protein
MITLTCTKCQTVLEMDDAFAGGVCRCQYCGTIQTVPSHLKRAARPASPSAAAQKALYSGAGATAGGAAGSTGVPSSGLDDLASAVASSGISSGLTRSHTGMPTPTGPAPAAVAAVTPAQRPAKKPNRMPLIAGGVGAGVVAIGLIAFLATRGGDQPKADPSGKPNATDTQTNNSNTPATPRASGPGFLGVPLGSSTKIAYIIDCSGSSHRDIFDSVRVALDRSLKSLRPEQQFQVLLWTEVGTGTQQAADRWFPAKGQTSATREQVAACQAKFADFIVTGKTEIGPAITRALEGKPDTIVIATGQGVNMDGAVLGQIKKAMSGKSGVTIHTIDLTQSAYGQSELEAAAKLTPGGQFRHVPPSQLDSF